MSLPIVPLSGEEVAFALLRAGFTLRGRDESSLVLERGLRHVEVPAASRLEPDVLLAILREAGVSYTQVVEHLDAANDLVGNTYESHVRIRPSGRRRQLAKKG